VWLYVRVPDARPIREVAIDGKEWTEIDAANERIRLPKSGKDVDVVIRY
jgi:hypothetical protein